MQHSVWKIHSCGFMYFFLVHCCSWLHSTHSSTCHASSGDRQPESLCLKLNNPAVDILSQPLIAQIGIVWTIGHSSVNFDCIGSVLCPGWLLQSTCPPAVQECPGVLSSPLAHPVFSFSLFSNFGQSVCLK